MTGRRSRLRSLRHAGAGVSAAWMRASRRVPDGDRSTDGCGAVVHRGFRVDAYLKAHPDANSEAADIEDLVQQGRAGGPCPYFLSREMAAGADLVLMPYNYLVDARTRFGMKGIQWRGSVLIFDEAHNVEVRGPRLCAPKHAMSVQPPNEGLHMPRGTMRTVLLHVTLHITNDADRLAHIAPAL